MDSNPENPTPQQESITKWPFVLAGLIIIALLVSVPLLNWWPFTTLGPQSLLWAWMGIMASIALFILLAGWAIVGWPLGALIDERNRMSLSRLQLVIWSILVLSAFLTIAFWNSYVNTPNTDPFAIQVPAELWVLLGISVTSLVGSPLVRSSKTTESPVPAQFALAQKRLAARRRDLNETDIGHTGLVLTLADPRQASPADLFEGEETGNPLLDMGKVQMFFFTIVIVLGYAAALGRLFAATSSSSEIRAFPQLDPSIVALLGISHAAYLAYKGVPHSQSTDAAPQFAPAQTASATAASATQVPAATAPALTATTAGVDTPTPEPAPQQASTPTTSTGGPPAAPVATSTVAPYSGPQPRRSIFPRRRS